MNKPVTFTPPQRYKLTQYPANAEEWKGWYTEIFEAVFNREYIPNQYPILGNLMLYASGNANALYPLTRGVYLWGKCGTGKSVLLEALRHMTITCWPDNWWRQYDCNAVALVRSEEAFAQYILWEKPAYYDDLGSEPLMVKLYGSELYPMVEVITARYNLWQRKGVPTHFTSNHDLQWVEEQYGTRVASRLAEMCTVTEVKGKNLRVTNQ
jgi:hypothetical protein